MAQGLLDQLSPETSQEIVSLGTRRRYPAKSYLFHAGDDSVAVYLVEVGLVRIDRSLSRGRQVMLTLAGPGDLLGELAVLDDLPRSATAATVTETRALVMPAQGFVDLVGRCPDLAAAVLRRVTRRLRGLTDQLVEVTSLTARSRIAARVVDLMALGGIADDAVGPVVVNLPISQEDLGSWAGLSREGAVKGLAQLRDDSLIETGRMQVTVLEPARLRDLAAEARL